MVFKEKWVAQFPWVKPIVDFTSKIHMVHYKDFSLVEGMDKLIKIKLNGLQKHVGKKKLEFLVHDFWWVIITSTMITNIKEMIGFMLTKL
jgi:hypothetical protein